MDDALLTNWYIALGIAAALIVAAAILLIMVWMAARRILRLASAALEIVVNIKENTESIWALEATNATATEILEGAESIREHAGSVAHALHEES